MPRLIAYKGIRLLAQAHQELIAQPQTRLVGYGKKRYHISLIKYGKLYVWDDLDFVKEFIEGMHVPSNDEWSTLSTYVNTYYNIIPNSFGVGNHLKHPRKNGTPILDSLYNTSTHPRWDAHATHYGRDTLNFSVIPGGERHSNGSSDFIGSRGVFWSTTVETSPGIYTRAFTSSSSSMFASTLNMYYGASFRLVRNATVAEQSLSDGKLVEQIQDYDGNWYDCIKIGTQVWTRQNLATTKYTDGTSVTCYDYDNDDENTFYDSMGDSIWAHFVNRL